MKRSITALLLTLAMLLSFVGCSAHAETLTDTEQATNVVVDVNASPEVTPHDTADNKAAAEGGASRPEAQPTSESAAMEEDTSDDVAARDTADPEIEQTVDTKTTTVSSIQLGEAHVLKAEPYVIDTIRTNLSEKAPDNGANTKDTVDDDKETVAPKATTDVATNYHDGNPGGNEATEAPAGEKGSNNAGSENHTVDTTASTASTSSETGNIDHGQHDDGPSVGGSRNRKDVSEQNPIACDGEDRGQSDTTTNTNHPVPPTGDSSSSKGPNDNGNGDNAPVGGDEEVIGCGDPDRWETGGNDNGDRNTGDSHGKNPDEDPANQGNADQGGGINDDVATSNASVEENGYYEVIRGNYIETHLAIIEDGEVIGEIVGMELIDEHKPCTACLEYFKQLAELDEEPIEDCEEPTEDSFYVEAPLNCGHQVLVPETCEVCKRTLEWQTQHPANDTPTSDDPATSGSNNDGSSVSTDDPEPPTPIGGDPGIPAIVEIVA